ncbi:transcriptional regulator [[Clostridium] leptum CAG:27]|uniref:Transcriptional regulator n=1 Tax=[Clostridium] leptum CAG:27 TaxID=1263068 RepID=R6P116_9FIRM|nr:transcriptional regulator [[Clostridium] leptum CAG:27]
MIRVDRKALSRCEIVRMAANRFLNDGFTKTTVASMGKALHMSTGNMTFYFATKEHMLAELVNMLVKYQWSRMESEAGEGSSIMAICLELTAMAAICDTNAAAKDFYLSTYSSPMCLEIIRKNDTARAKEVFAQYCPDWTDEQFAEAEVLVSGIEYATLMTVGDPVSLETRIAGALNGILQIYKLPEETRRVKIRRVLAMDYRAIAERMLTELKQFVIDTNEQALAALYREKGLEMP